MLQNQELVIHYFYSLKYCPKILEKNALALKNAAGTLYNQHVFTFFIMMSLQ